MSQQFESRRRRNSSVRRSAVDTDKRYQGFVRSRTLTGSQSSQVAAASEKRGFLISSRLKAQNLKKHRSLLFSAVIFSWLVVGGSIFLLDQYIGRPAFRIEGVAMEKSLAETLQNSTQEYFFNRPLERFRFAVDETQLLNFLAEEVPEVETIKLENAAGLAKSDAKVSLRRPVAKWQLAGTTYYVDATGQAFERNFFSEPSVKVRDNSGLPPSEQRRLASRQLLTFIGQIVDGINKSPGVSQVKEVIIPPASLKGLDITLVGESYRIKLHTDRDISAQVADLRAAVGYVKRYDITPSYLDVRVAGKAYYR